MIRCPTCNTEVQPDWDWCHVCGWDPEGLRPAGVGPPARPAGVRAPAPGPTAAPPAHVGAPPPFGAGPGYGGPPPGRPGSYGAPALGRSAGRTVLRVALACGGALVGIIVVSVLAVTLLGDPSAEKALVIPTTVTTSKPAPTQWQRWTASDGSFGVDVPTPPQFGPVPGDQSDFATTEQAVSTYGKTEYGMFYFQLPSDYYFPDPYPTMNSVLDGLSEDIGVTYSSRTRGTFGFLPSLSFTGSMDGGAGTVQGMAFVSEQRFYVMYAEAYDGELVDYQHFVDSFATG